jgi:hypothetical protein
MYYLAGRTSKIQIFYTNLDITTTKTFVHNTSNSRDMERKSAEHDSADQVPVMKLATKTTSNIMSVKADYKEETASQVEEEAIDRSVAGGRGSSELHRARYHCLVAPHGEWKLILQ